MSKALVYGEGGYVARFSVFVNRVAANDTVCVVGDCEALGNGDINRALALDHSSTPNWTVVIPLHPHVTHVKYRYLIKRAGNVVAQEHAERSLQLNDGDTQFLRRGAGQAGLVVAPCERAFVFEDVWKGAGVALPVFAIRSKEGCGVGEFCDLNGVVDFCVRGGYKLLQLLPINDTACHNSVKDTYPYSAVSSFALHPQYLNIEALGEMPADMMDEYRAERERLNQCDTIDYLRMMDVKQRFIRRMYKMQKNEFLESKAFTQWFQKNQDWLVPYALFRFFMEVNGTSDYESWGARSSISIETMQKLASPHSFHFEYLGVVYYTQYHLHKQLLAASEYAAKNQVVFKGDLPIGVNRHCVDTWVNPHLFRLDMQAGAPPDFFSTHGQNWLFPTYDWEAMKKDNYGWWRARLGHMANYFHAYRIDHILGFFRIWEIPRSFRTGMSGRFYPAHAISRGELESMGLWDIDRYIKPYVRDGLLQELFGDSWWKIKERFFEPLYHDRLQFREEYNTEKKAEAALAATPDMPESERKYGEFVTKQLFTLFNNVCLLQDVEDPDMFHPRFHLHDTSSYAELPDDQWKSALHRLHEDYMHKRQDELWKRNGLERLPMMKSASDMLVCGEDLGMIPNCVPSVMTETGILSLAVQRMPAGDEEIGNPAEYKYECVATTSSHDTSTFRGWWEEIPDDMRARYWHAHMHRDGTPPAQCTAEIVEWAVTDHLKCPAMWTIFPVQDLLGMDAKLRRSDVKAEQINDPSNPDHVWNFRLHVSMEEIMNNTSFMDKLASLNKENKRGVAY